MEQNEQKQFQCSGDCLRCLPVQRAYCASQHAYNTMRLMERIDQRMTEMEGRFLELTKVVEGIHDNEALVFNPLQPATTAQDGDGV